MVGWWILGGLALLMVWLWAGLEGHLLGLFYVGGGVALIYAHLGLFWLLDDLITPPAAIVAIGMVDVAVIGALRWWEQRPAPPPPNVLPQAECDRLLARSAAPSEVVEALRTARHELHESLLACPWLRAERVGLVFVTGEDYLYLKRTTVSLDPVREHTETLGCEWELGRAGKVTLTIDDQARPQFRVWPGRARYPGTPQGLNLLVMTSRIS